MVIVKDAGVTTGAFYGYYNSKEELFEALVDDKYQHIINMYVSTQNEFLMLLTASAGTKYENMIHEMCEVETKVTYDFIKVIDKGKVAQEGNPAQLIKEDGIYSDMLRLQMGQ